MTTIASYISNIDAVKQAIKTSITNKGVSVTGVAFTGYAGKIDEISGSCEYTESALHEMTISAFNEVVLTPNTVLPSSQPSTPTISVTIAAGNLPTLSGDTPAHIQYVPYPVYKVTNGGSTAQTLNYILQKNGTTFASGSGSIAAGSSRSQINYYLEDIAVGDVITGYFWGSTALTLTNFNVLNLPGIIKCVNDPTKVISDLYIGQTSLGHANFGLATGASNNMNIKYANSNTFSFSSGMALRIDIENTTYGNVAMYHGLFSKSNYISTTSSTRHYAISSIKWRETNLVAV